MRLFAGYRDRVGQRSLSLELPREATVGFLAGEIVRLYPELTRDPEGLVVAVNDEYRDHGFALDDGDEVALIPPVSGGQTPSEPSPNMGLDRGKETGREQAQGSLVV